MISKFLICSVCTDTLPCEILWECDTQSHFQRISHKAERIVVWQHWLIRLIRQPFQTDCKNIRKRTKKWENESSGRVVISFGVTANKSKQMGHVHLWNTTACSGPKDGTDRELGPAVLLLQEEAAGTLSSVCQKESVRAIPSWLHSRVTSLFSALLPCKYAGEVSSVWWCFCTWTSLLFDRAAHAGGAGMEAGVRNSLSLVHSLSAAMLR